MHSNQATREYIVNALNELGGSCPEQYITMLRQTPENKTISNLRPWAFDHDPESAIQFCSEALGRPVLPFAQAIGQDMMACFLPEPSANPAVVVINPWSEDKAKVLKAELADYNAWMDYAAEVSRQVQAREAEEDDE
jgi:hypothetical protein